MQNYSDIPENDIAKEPYKGPSEIAAAAGEGFIAHFQWALLGLLGGGLATWLFHKPVLNKITEWRAMGARLIDTDNTFQRGIGKLINGIFGYGNNSHIAPEKMYHIAEEHRHGFGRVVLNHTVGLFPGGKDLIRKHMQDDRMTVAVTGGGLFAFVGYIILPWFLAGKGAEKGKAGRVQFERAKDEIWDLRAENDKLREKNVDLKTRLTDAETTKAADENRLRVTKDDPPVIRDDNEGVALQAAEHPETPTTIESPPVKEPEIKEPMIGPANTTGRTLERDDRDWSELMQAQKAEQQAKEATIH